MTKSHILVSDTTSVTVRVVGQVGVLPCSPNLRQTRVTSQSGDASTLTNTVVPVSMMPQTVMCSRSDGSSIQLKFTAKSPVSSCWLGGGGFPTGYMHTEKTKNVSRVSNCAQIVWSRVQKGGACLIPGSRRQNARFLEVKQARCQSWQCKRSRVIQVSRLLDVKIGEESALCFQSSTEVCSLNSLQMKSLKSRSTVCTSREETHPPRSITSWWILPHAALQNKRWRKWQNMWLFRVLLWTNRDDTHWLHSTDG